MKVGASHDKKEEHSDHLIQSIEHYQKAVRLDPEDKLARLGLAWMYEQASDIAAKIPKIEGLTSRPQTRAWWYEKALTTYRTLHNEYRQEEFDGPDQMIDLANTFPSMEAAQRIQIIVEVKGFGKFQRGEKAKISETVRKLEKKRRGITPIVVPLGSDDPSMLVDWGSSVSFDLLGDGVTQKQGWVTPQAGRLCWDPKGQGAITSGRQLFGTGTFWMFFANGFEAMSSLDDDGDGWLRGSELDGVCLWHDSDSDGRSDVREVRPVSEWGILALRCGGYGSGSIGLEVDRGVVWRDGRVTKLYDWITR